MDIFDGRRQRAQELMVQRGVAALHVTSRENYFYLTGDARNVARIFLPQMGEPTVIVFDEEIESAKKSNGRRGCSGMAESAGFDAYLLFDYKRVRFEREEGWILCSHHARLPSIPNSEIESQDDGNRKRRDTDAAPLGEGYDRDRCDA